MASKWALQLWQTQQRLQVGQQMHWAGFEGQMQRESGFALGFWPQVFAAPQGPQIHFQSRSRFDREKVQQPLETFQFGKLDLTAPDQHLAVLGTSMQSGHSLAGVEQALWVECEFERPHLFAFSV